MVVKRADGEIVVDGGIEEWTRIPEYKQGRKGIPAKMSLTAFGAPWTPAARSDSRNARGAIGGAEVPADPIGPRAIPESAPPMETRDPAEVPEPAQRNHFHIFPEGLVSGFPPRSIPKHGPGYMDLSGQQKRETR